MPPQSSFIPKQTKKSGNMQSVRKVSFPILSIISYALFIGSLIASGVVFVYATYTSNLLKEVVTKLDSEITDFSTADLSTLVDFNQRINDSTKIIEGHISTVAILDYLERLSLQTIKYEEIKLVRSSDTEVEVEAKVNSSEFDGLLLQRQLLRDEEDKTIANFSVSDITYMPESITEEGEVTPKIISFTLELTLPIYQFSLMNQIDLFDPISIETESNPEVEESIAEDFVEEIRPEFGTDDVLVGSEDDEI